VRFLAIHLGKVKQNKTSIITPDKKPGNLCRFAVPQRSELTKFFCISEGHNLQRYSQIHVGLRHQSSESGPHLFESNGDFSLALLASVGYH
jgi:hypothetical protein